MRWSRSLASRSGSLKEEQVGEGVALFVLRAISPLGGWGGGYSATGSSGGRGCGCESLDLGSFDMPMCRPSCLLCWDADVRGPYFCGREGKIHTAVLGTGLLYDIVYIYRCFV